MTLSPVFRSSTAIQVFQEEGVWNRLGPAARGQAEAIATIRRDLQDVLDSKFVETGPTGAEAETVRIEFLQEFFFLILFRAVLQTIGIRSDGLQVCSEINFCIKGTITAADNLFDGQDKLLLPLKGAEGSCFRSILQLLAFQRLTHRVLARGVGRGCIGESDVEQIQRELLSCMAAIGTLEGSEEGGIRDVLPPERMIDQVHRTRGGALFELAFVVPYRLLPAPDSNVLARAQRAISKMGTAFQIVDDLTDFEFDVTHGRHNLLVAQITHHGSARERSLLAGLNSKVPEHDVVITDFSDSARAVMARGEREIGEALEELESLGFWLSPHLGHQLLRAIVGLEGVARMHAL